jgi:two-component system sensor histidine kinase BaeS
MAEPRLRGSLRGRLAIVFVAVAITAVAALAVVIVLTTRSETSRLSATDRARTAAEAARVLADSYRRAGSWATADLTAAQLIAAEADAGLAVRDATGQPVQGESPRSGRGYGLGRGPRNGRGPLIVTQPVELESRRVGTVELRYRRSLSPTQSLLRTKLLTAVLLGSAIAVAIALLGAALVSRAITLPLRRLAAAARRLRAGDLTARSNTATAPGELGQLSAAFDGMADTLHRERGARRRLVSELSHEVRTPVAILQGNLEELVDGIADATPQRLASLHEEVLRLGALVEDLDALAHADAPVTRIDRAPVELAELARAQLEVLRPRLEAKALTVEQHLTPVTVIGDRTRLGQVLANLLGNAIKFTPNGGQITVTVDPVDRAGRVMVDDSGPGIPTEERDLVFERFRRGSAARDISGRGIGLAVADEITRAHGGTIELQRSNTGGARFIVTVPTS